MSLKKVLVTGAEGLVGKQLLPRLVQEKFQLSVFVRHVEDASFYHKQGIQVFLGNVSDKACLAQAVAAQEAVIHLIGCFAPALGETLDQINYSGTATVHALAQENKVSKFIFLSAYGASLGVQNAFLVSKGQAEVDIMQGEVPYVILRATPIYGARSALVHLLRHIAEKGKAPRFSKGKHPLQPIYVNDVVEYVVQALQGPAATQRVLEIGGPDKVSFEELVLLTAELLGKKIQWSRVPGFLQPWLAPLKFNGQTASQELLDFLSRDNFVSVERAHSIIPITLTPLRVGLQQSLM